jgi:hypothetical protein
MASFINAITTSGGGIETSADASGVLELKTDGVTALTVDASQNVVLTNPLPVASGGSGLTSVGVAGNIMVSDGTTLVSNTLAQAAIVAVADIGVTVLGNIVDDTTPQLGGALDGQNNNMTNIGTVSGSNLQLDFGGL